MKRVVALILVVVCISCANERKTGPESISANSLATQPNNTVILKDSVVGDTLPVDSAQTQLCSITAVYNTSYCGGAAPPQELLKTLAKHIPLRNTAIHLHLKGTIRGPETSHVLELDKSGKSSVRLKEGLWEYGLTSAIDKSISGINPECEITVQKKYGTFTVKKGDKNKFYLLYHFDCDPCDPDMKKRP
ncbi:MAG TPA: hypothetical protein VD905_04635 [Flavobacteriales bacterium]|nr:hypothetical protein [Flavobacteriales bacterium]